MKVSWITEAIMKGDLSLNERLQVVQRAVSAQFNSGPGEYCYADITFDDYVIIRKGGKLWRVELEWTADGSVKLASDAKLCYQAFPLATTESTRFEGQVFGLMADDAVQPMAEAGAAATAQKMTGKRWGVVIIQEGMSKNRNNYQRKALQEAAPLYEGAKIFVDHQEAKKYGRSVRDQAGFLKDVRPCILNTGTKEAEATGVFALAATAVITKADIRTEMVEAYEEGNPNLFGLSHDAMCRSVTTMDERQVPYYDVTKIESVDSVDLVTNPAAGGRVLRLVASDTEPHTLKEDGNMLKKMIEGIKGSGNTGLIAKLEALGANPNEDQVLAIYSEALTGTKPTKEAAPAAPASPAAGAIGIAPVAGAAPAAVPVKEAAAPAAGALRQVSEAEWNGLMADNRTQFLEAQLGGVALIDDVKARIRQRFADQITAGAIPTREAITQVIKEEVDFWGRMAEKNLVMPAAGAPRIEVGAGRREKMQEAIDEFFGVKSDATARGGFKVIEGSPMTSFRRLYVELTGDIDVTGKVKEAKRLTESLTTASFGEILGDSITRRMVADYQQAPEAQWRGTIAEVVPVSDFRTQRRMRFGGYGNLSTVAQAQAYPSMTSPTDEEATYAPAKRGGTEQVTIEMIANDDVGAIRRIPTRMAQAAVRTLNEFVLDFMRTNAAVYDSTALAASRSGGVNISTTALSATQINILRRLMKQQADMSSGKRIGIPARYLWVPTDLEELSFWLTTSDKALPDSSIPGTAAGAAPNFLRKLGITPMVVDYWDDTNNYWLTSSVRDVPMIEIGFLGGREEPELLVQDQPNQGSLFSNDVITYKIRHIYGGGVLDFRGFAGGIVA